MPAVYCFPQNGLQDSVSRKVFRTIALINNDGIYRHRCMHCKEPACVAACPAGSLQFGEYKEKQQYAGKLQKTVLENHLAAFASQFAEKLACSAESDFYKIIAWFIAALFKDIDDHKK